MTPTQARAFLAVAIEGSFTGAAKRLNPSQPSVTTQVGLLERQYKVELFHRIGRGVRLTPAGNALLPTVRRLFTSLDEATTYLEDLRGQRQGYLRVGSYTPHRFIVLVARYKKRFPGASIWVEFANSQALAKKVLNYELAVAVTARENVLPAFTRLRSRAPSNCVPRTRIVKPIGGRPADRYSRLASEPSRSDRQSRGGDSRGRGRDGAWHYFRRRVAAGGPVGQGSHQGASHTLP